MVRLILVGLLLPGPLWAQGLPALPDGKAPNDSRLKPPVTLHDYHPFRPVTSKEEWPERQEEIVRRIAVSCGLWPQPTKTPLNAVI
ncbi:MAG: hypothetical protein H8E96_08115, partial [Verrucomicrobiaceae bacterium]|nr:hypothetical protein [Verrucomicrobiaceae bacterium]